MQVGIVTISIIISRLLGCYRILLISRQEQWLNNRIKMLISRRIKVKQQSN